MGIGNISGHVGPWDQEEEEEEQSGQFNRTFGESSSSFSQRMVLWARILWDVLFFSIILVAIVGNLIVLWVIVGKRFYVAIHSFKML